MKLKKTELTITVDEKSLVQFLFVRHKNQIEEADLHTETSIIRNFTIDTDGKCAFRICAVSLLNESLNFEAKPDLENQIISPSSIRIRKTKKESNDS